MHQVWPVLEQDRDGQVSPFAHGKYHRELTVVAMELVGSGKFFMESGQGVDQPAHLVSVQIKEELALEPGTARR